MSLLFWRKASRNAEPPVPKNGKKILIVDDDLVLTKALSGSLERRGFEVLTAPDCAEALAPLRDSKPDLLLLDIHFPPAVGTATWDGFRFMEWRRQTAGLEMPVIMMSASEDISVRKRALDEGAACFLAKPFTPAELLTEIDRILASTAN